MESLQSNSEHSEAPKIFKKLFLESLRSILKDYNVSREVAVLFSGGVDSLCIVLGMLELGYKPAMLYTVHLEEYQSEDARASIHIKNLFDLRLRIVTLGQLSSKENLSSFIKLCMSKSDYISRKAKIETIVPFCYLFKAIGDNKIMPFFENRIKLFLIGFGGDDLNGGTTKSASIQFRNSDIESYRKYREEFFNQTKNVELVEYNKLLKIFHSQDSEIIDPYYHSEQLVDYMLKHFKTYRELHEPYQKWVLREAFKEWFERYPFLWRRQSGMQSESKFREWFKTTLKTDSVIKTYNQFLREIKQEE